MKRITTTFIILGLVSSTISQTAVSASAASGNAAAAAAAAASGNAAAASAAATSANGQQSVHVTANGQQPVISAQNAPTPIIEERAPIAASRMPERKPEEHLIVNPSGRQPQITLAGRSTDVPEDLGTCDSQDYFLYQGQCIAKACLNDKLSRIHLTPLDDILGNIGSLNLGIAYTVDIQDASQPNMTYQVTIKYNDDEENQIVSDPVNCVDWALYQTNNEFEIDNTRKFLTGGEGSKPSWPVSTYQFSAGIASVNFNITQDDLDTRQCLKFTTQDKIYWECYFELAFMVKGVTQVSYYMCIRICLETNVAAAVPAVNFVKIIQVDRCPPEGGCSASISISSSLRFCEDNTCANTDQAPFQILFLNRPFYMRFQIDDPAFQNFYIKNVTINYQTQGFKLLLSESEFNILNHAAGFNSIQLSVPIVADQVIISAAGQISSNQSRILQQSENKVNVAHASKTVGPIKASDIENSLLSLNNFLLSAGLLLLGILLF